MVEIVILTVKTAKKFRLRRRLRRATAYTPARTHTPAGLKASSDLPIQTSKARG